MRRDLAKVVTERPRSNHHHRSSKHGVRLSRVQIELARDDEHYDGGSAWLPRSRTLKTKQFTDLIGPLRKALRKQVGRPWDAVWSELSAVLDTRSITGQHILDHVEWEVARNCRLGAGGQVLPPVSLKQWCSDGVVTGLYVHPRTGLLCYRERPALRKPRAVAHRNALHQFRLVPPWTTNERNLARFRVDGLQVWEKQPHGWMIHRYREIPARLVTERQWWGETTTVLVPPGREHVSTKQASQREIRDARSLLERPPF